MNSTFLSTRQEAIKVPAAVLNKQTGTKEEYSDFRDFVHQELYKKLDYFYQNIPYARHLEVAESVDEAYFVRHQIEIILRLRMKRIIDALTIHYFTKESPMLAKKWAAYTDDEMLHDKMFIKDLEKCGLTYDEVYETEVFFSTKLLQGYFYYGLEHEGNPLASLTSSYFIEYMSTIVLPGWNKHVADKLGIEKVRGSTAHVDHDLQDSHVDFVWSVLSNFITSVDVEKKIIQHIDNIFRLFCMFYEELYAKTICKIDDKDFHFGGFLNQE